MSTIENSIYQENVLDWINNIPPEIYSKLNFSNYVFKSTDEKIEVIIISSDSAENLVSYISSLGGEYEDLGYGFGLVKIAIKNIVALLSNKKIQYMELPKSLYLSFDQSNSAVCVSTGKGNNGLLGEGVLVGFIDTGIDYTHSAFRNEDGSSRIEFIYDLSGNGVVYDKKQINDALNAPDPYSILNSIDTVGHGTHVAGIACAGGKISSKYYGVAPKSSIAAVKVTRGQYSLSTSIMRGLKFLVDRSKELDMPLVVNISLSTNDGAHNGSSLLEKYIDTVAALERISIVIAAGNEGEASHHVGGTLNSVNEISFNVASDESLVIINLYKSLLPKVSVEFKSPEGVSTGEINIDEGVTSGVIGKSRYRFVSSGAKPFDINGEIIIALSGVEEYVSSGQWKIFLRKRDDYDGTFDMWLPISEGLNVKTKFLNPNIYNTLGIPATVRSVISVGSYNYLTNTISSFSGRGSRDFSVEIKPDVVAPGEGINSVAPNNSSDTKTGTSMAAPHVTGICALLMQWGIVQKKDPYLFGERLRYFVIEGAKRNRSDIKYPDPSWGYGEACFEEALNIVSDTVNKLFRVVEDDNTSRQNEGDNTSNQDTVFLLAEIPTNETIEKIESIPGVDALRISEQFVIIITPPSEIDEVSKVVTRIISIEDPTLLTLNAKGPIEASGAQEISSNPYFNINGRGVLVGIIDTGIDYLNEEFMREDGTTRILSIWDQNIPGDKPVLNLKLGTEYTREQIDEAIKLKNSGGDPYTIVPSKDTIGHGTNMASIIGGRGINPQLKGIAFDSEFVIVKLKQAGKTERETAYIDSAIPVYTPWSVMLALRYINIIASREERPVVIYIPLGSNMGGHDGTGIIEGAILNYSKQVGTIVVVSTGNQGDTETHTEGIISVEETYKDIELRIGENQKRIPIQIWINKPNRVKLSIISPSGEIIENLTSKSANNEKINFLYEGTEMIVDFTNPESITGNGLILIKASNLKSGIWKFRLIPEYIVDGKYYAWIPQRELLDKDTKFLSPSENSTLTLPSTSDGAISIAYYNQEDNSVVGASGRGFTTEGVVRPDIAAGGINAIVAKPGGGTSIISGSSVAGAVASGCCALILQWAIVNGNEKELYTTQLRTYLITSAAKRSGDVYPNREWGYGMLDLPNFFEIVREMYSPKTREGIKEGIEEGIKYEEYNVGELFIRNPL